MNNFYMGIDNTKDLEFERAVEELARKAREAHDISDPVKVIGAQ